MLKKWKVVIKRDDDGLVKSISLPEDFAEVSDEELSFLDEDESELKHANISKKSWKVVIERDDNGFVKSISLPEDFAEVSDEEVSFMDEEPELKHYGVMGMKWGIQKDPADAAVRKTRGSMVRNRRLLSDDQLAATVKRLEMEKKLKELAADDLAPGKMALNNTLGKIVGTAFGAAAGVAGAAIVKQILASKGIKT
jgi:hypothetical protein